MRPNYEEPLDTAKQLAEKKITLYDGPGFELWKEFLLESSNADYNKLGETYIITDHWDNFYNMIEHNVIGAGTHALMTYSLAPYELAMGRWHRSKEKVAGFYPYGGYLTNKKWHLNEVFFLNNSSISHPILNHDRKWQTIYYVFSKYEILGVV